MIQSSSGNLRQVSHTTPTIDAVTNFIQSHLCEETGLTVYTKDPEEFQKSCQTNYFSNSLVLFLYKILVNTRIKPPPPEEGEQSQEPPIPLVLKYIITTFDKNGKSNTPEAHMMLSQAAMSLHQISFPCLALTEAPPFLRPEELKITFEDVSTKLLSQLFQCPDDKYRFSLGFQIQPVLISGGETHHSFYMPSLGHTAKDQPYPPQDVQQEPLLYPRITNISAPYLQAGDGFFVSGENLKSEHLKIMLGSHEIDVLDRSYNLLSCHLPSSLILSISAGNYKLTAKESQPGKPANQSAGITVHLLPSIETVSISHTGTSQEYKTGTINITGNFLGNSADKIAVGLYLKENPVAIFYEVKINSPQTQLQVEITQDHRLPAGTYRLILRVNGEYALYKPEIEWGLRDS